MRKHPLTYYIRRNHKNAVASKSTETTILNHDFNDKTLWTLLVNNADGKADMRSTKIQYLMRNNYSLAPKCPNI